MINLNQLRDLFGNEQLLLKYISMFKVSGPENLRNIREAFTNKDMESFVIAAHGLKTQFAYLSNKEAHEITVFLENTSLELFYSSDKSIHEALKVLSDEMEKTIFELSVYLST